MSHISNGCYRDFAEMMATIVLVICVVVVLGLIVLFFGPTIREAWRS